MPDSGLGYSCGVNGHGGVIRVRAETIKGVNLSSSTGQGVGFFWWAGLNIIECQSLAGSNNAISTDASTGSGAVDAYVTAEEIYTDGSIDIGIQGVINNYSGSNANAALWVRCDTIKASISSGYCYIYTEVGSLTKFYLECEKAYGQAICKSGLVYVNSQKVEALANVGSGLVATTALFADCSGGTLRYNVTQHDPKSFTGIGFLVDGGTIISNALEYTSGSGSNGLSISGGLARIQTALFDTSANSSGNPITKSGGTLILMACTLVANSGRDSITAGTAQNVVAMSSWTNKAANGNITVTTTGGLTVDTHVQ
jgi:hypothetical protein